MWLTVAINIELSQLMEWLGLSWIKSAQLFISIGVDSTHPRIDSDCCDLSFSRFGVYKYRHQNRNRFLSIKISFRIKSVPRRPPSTYTGAKRAGFRGGTR